MSHLRYGVLTATYTKHGSGLCSLQEAVKRSEGLPGAILYHQPKYGDMRYVATRIGSRWVVMEGVSSEEVEALCPTGV